jgi:hypothetical protein
MGPWILTHKHSWCYNCCTAGCTTGRTCGCTSAAQVTARPPRILLLGILLLTLFVLQMPCCRVHNGQDLRLHQRGPGDGPPPNLLMGLLPLSDNTQQIMCYNCHAAGCTTGRTCGCTSAAQETALPPTC